jgi:hypothetical protein
LCPALQPALAVALSICFAGVPLIAQQHPHAGRETYRGEALHDRQHPHDLFMELSALYERAITRRRGLMLYLAPVGEPESGAHVMDPEMHSEAH